jgi:hypothetical protein
MRDWCATGWAVKRQGVETPPEFGSSDEGSFLRTTPPLLLDVISQPAGSIVGECQLKCPRTRVGLPTGSTRP